MTESSEREFWEQTYESGDYLKHWDYTYPSQELAGFLATGVVKLPGTVLDVGCGSGREAVFLAEQGFTVIGVDISSKALEIAQQRAEEAGVSIDCRQGNFLELPVEDDSVDFINDRGALHLVGEEDRPKFASEMSRVLKPGGFVLIRGASENETEESFTPITEESLDRYFPKTVFSRGMLLPITLVSDAGTLDARILVLQKL